MKRKEQGKNENDSRKGEDRLMALLIAIRFDPGAVFMTKMMKIMNDDDVLMVTVPKKSDARYTLVNDQVIYIACSKSFCVRKRKVHTSHKVLLVIQGVRDLLRTCR